MSAYSAVVPVAWQRLQQVLEAWCGVLVQTGSLESFGRAYAADAAEWLADIPPTLLAGYLESIGWPTGTGILLSSALRASPIHAQLEDSGIAEAGDEFLAAAIKTEASADIASGGRFDNYYARLQDPPRTPVAGFKNRPYVLETAFSFSYDRQAALYRCRSIPEVPSRLADRLSELFLSVRAFPGVSVLSESMAWPAFDDLRIVGYLMPKEVRELSEDLGSIDFRQGTDDRLVPLFIDRVKHSARGGHGLVAVHSGL